MTLRIAHTPAKAVTIVVAARKTGAVSTVIVPKSAAFATPTSASTASKAPTTRFLSIRNHPLSLFLQRLHKRPGDEQPTEKTSTAHQKFRDRQIARHPRREASPRSTGKSLNLSFTSAR